MPWDRVGERKGWRWLVGGGGRSPLYSRHKQWRQAKRELTKVLEMLPAMPQNQTTQNCLSKTCRKRRRRQEERQLQNSAMQTNVPKRMFKCLELVCYMDVAKGAYTRYKACYTCTCMHTEKAHTCHVQAKATAVRHKQAAKATCYRHAREVVK